jgi:hypothetical protein
MKQDCEVLLAAAQTNEAPGVLLDLMCTSSSNITSLLTVLSWSVQNAE